jgi:hypothetical protein
MRYLASPTYTTEAPEDSLVPLAATAALITAAIELPISQFYGTVPKTTTGARMAIAGSMAFISVLLGGALVKMVKRAG